MTDSENPTPPSPGASADIPKPPAPPAIKARAPWHKRMPSTRRFLLWNLLCWFFGASALVGGILYTEHVVKPVAEGGGTSFGPTKLFEKEVVGQRVFGNNDRMNILILGIDYNHDSKGIIYTTGARSDTIMVMSLSREGKFLNLVSIPRDTRVYLGDGYGYDKINAAYSYGGVEQAKKVVSAFLGVPIHHHLVVKVTGAKKLVDVIGGLPIDVEKDLDYDDNWGNLHIHLKKGPQVLTGEQAVGYARFRMDEEGDRGRIRRQQQVIKALGSRVKDPALAMKFPSIAEVVKETLDTDFKPLEMVDLATLYGSFDFKQMRSAAIVGDDAFDSNGSSYIEPYAPENERTVRRLLRSLDWVAKGDLRIRIYFKNASPDIAYRLADRLADSGFDGVAVEALSADDKRDTSTTYLVWFNKVSRLQGILSAVTGKLPERKGEQAKGRDDDLVVVLGDNEAGKWAELPDHLKQPRSSAGYRDNNRYNGDFVPRYLPPPDDVGGGSSGYSEGSGGSAEVEAEDSGEDVTEESYPKATPDPVEEPSVDEGADYNTGGGYETEYPQAAPVEPAPAPVDPAPAPVEVAPPPVEPAPAPMPAATPVDGGAL